MNPMTVAQLRAILKDAPDDARVIINPVFAGEEPGERSMLTVTQGEVLGVEWAPSDYPQQPYVFLVADEDPRAIGASALTA